MNVIVNDQDGFIIQNRYKTARTKLFNSEIFNMKQFLSILDTFGVPLNLQFQQKKSLFKSHLGGLFTLIIYSLSLTYAIYIFYQWQKNQISPKMFSSSTISTFENLNLDYEYISIGYYTNYNSELIDPFLQQNNIITPLLQTFYENGTVQIESLLNTTVQENPQAYGRTIQIKMGINFYKPDGSLFQDGDKTILFAKCDPQYLKEGETCASDEQSAAFFAQSGNLLMLKLNPILLNQQNKPVQNSQQFYFNVEEQLCYNMNLDLKTNIYAVNQNLISQNTQLVEYMDSSIAYGQTNSVQYAMNSYGMITYGTIYLTLQPSQTQITIQYPQIGELLASVGSILSLLFLFKYIIYEINSHLLKTSILEEIIGFYYPEFANFNIQYNIFRQMKSVSLHNNQLNLEQFKKTYNKLMEKAEHKMSFINLIYEQSRLFMILRSLKNQTEFRKCHEMGIQLDSTNRTPFQSPREQLDSEVPISITSIFDDNDFDLISLSQRREYLELINDEPPISNETVRKK